MISYSVNSGSMCFCSLRTQQQEGKILLQGAVVILNILNGVQSGAKLPLKLLYNQPGDAGYQLI